MSVRIERAGRVTTVILARAEARNAMTPEMAQALYRAFLDFEADEAADVAVLWGEGGAFCAGWDLKRAAEIGPEAVAALDFPDGWPETGPSQAPMGPSRLSLSKPVIAAVAGPAVAGGMELALWCDLRVMEESAFMGVYCRRWGVPLIDGGTVRLPRLVGMGRAADLILTGRRVDAAEAARIGLAEYIVPEGMARARAEELAQALTRFPQETLRADRASLRAQAGLPEAEALRREWEISAGTVARAGQAGAARFAAGRGRHGDFEDI